MIIYKITNILNNKVYIGLTVQNLNDRFKQHLNGVNSGSNCQLHRAIRKYGVENFKVEKICRCNSIDKMKKLEILFIKKFNSFENGYNMTSGGDGCTDYWKGKKHKQSTKDLMKIKMIGNDNAKFRVNFVKVDLLDSDGKIIKTFNSIKEAADELKIKCPSDITSYCRGYKKSFNKGFIFRYSNRKYKTKNDENHT
jgi:hypothetical protein